MSAYNRINGVFASENPWLLTDVLREEWGYDGLVISDWGAVHDPVAAVAAGLDLRMPGQPGDPRVRDALANGQLDEAVVDRVAERLRLLASRTEDSRKTKPVVDFDAHHQVARRAAAESAVLLHNDGALLPIDPAAVGSIAVIGELARTPRYQGAGSSAVNATRVVTALDALQTRLEETTSVSFAPGYSPAIRRGRDRLGGRSGGPRTVARAGGALPWSSALLRGRRTRPHHHRTAGRPGGAGQSRRRRQPARRRRAQQRLRRHHC